MPSLADSPNNRPAALKLSDLVSAPIGSVKGYIKEPLSQVVVDRGQVVVAENFPYKRRLY